MVDHVNFYENLNEALMRIKQTVVLYDGDPFYVHTVTNHKGDGIFRVYITELERMANCPQPPCGMSIPHGHTAMGQYMDTFMTENPGWITRKHMNSPHFNKFRPFPLGMMNNGEYAVYVTRQPIRPKTEQGLVSSALFTSKVACNGGQNHGVSMYGQAFADCIKGVHPSPRQALEYVTSPDTANVSVAFHREFAFIRGPIDMVFLGYKDDVIGVLPNGDLDRVKLGKEFLHAKEAIQDLNLFQSIQ